MHSSNVDRWQYCHHKVRLNNRIAKGKKYEFPVPKIARFFSLFAKAAKVGARRGAAECAGIRACGTTGTENRARAKRARNWRKKDRPGYYAAEFQLTSSRLMPGSPFRHTEEPASVMARPASIRGPLNDRFIFNFTFSFAHDHCWLTNKGWRLFQPDNNIELSLPSLDSSTRVTRIAGKA